MSVAFQEIMVDYFRNLYHLHHRYLVLFLGEGYENTCSEQVAR